MCLQLAKVYMTGKGYEIVCGAAVVSRYITGANGKYPEKIPQAIIPMPPADKNPLIVRPVVHSDMLCDSPEPVLNGFCRIVALLMLCRICAIRFQTVSFASIFHARSFIYCPSYFAQLLFSKHSVWSMADFENNARPQVENCFGSPPPT
ncbi:hypothetical protein AVEN_37373-1 [Araneus ventricosus]|uniref:Uncharacterized protein n=1 Tax=Araneus ventricosus TaxID=182803 RepID=A0A4Y2MDY7_ARAVE|nr:hypothetical protein AVEN_37373-1 [Araneus ventricosus]